MHIPSVHPIPKTPSWSPHFGKGWSSLAIVIGILVVGVASLGIAGLLQSSNGPQWLNGLILPMNGFGIVGGIGLIFLGGNQIQHLKEKPFAPPQVNASPVTPPVDTLTQEDNWLSRLEEKKPFTPITTDDLTPDLIFAYLPEDCYTYTTNGRGKHTNAKASQLFTYYIRNRGAVKAKIGLDYTQGIDEQARLLDANIKFISLKNLCQIINERKGN